MQNKPRILFFAGEDSSFCTHRLALAQYIQSQGFEVAVTTRCTRYQAQIEQAGITLFPLKSFHRSSFSPWREFNMLKELYQIYRQFKPTLVHHIAMKPIVYGSLIAKCTNRPLIINAFTGLGHLFTKQATLSVQKKCFRLFMIKILRFILNTNNTHLIFQNQDDINCLKKLNCLALKQNNIHLIKGAGVNVKQFNVHPMPPSPPILIACVSRLLKDKGILELIGAARLLKENQISARIILYGLPDPANPSSLSKKQIQTWVREKLIDWQGYCHDVARAYANCHIAVLPSYREGFPKSLLEAASCGRPIVTTDVPGCREIVSSGENGILVEVQSSQSLYKGLLQLIQDRNLREKMGKQSRRRVEQFFSDHLIYQQTLKVYQDLIATL